MARRTENDIFTQRASYSIKAKTRSIMPYEYRQSRPPADRRPTINIKMKVDATNVVEKDSEFSILDKFPMKFHMNHLV